MHNNGKKQQMTLSDALFKSTGIPACPPPQQQQQQQQAHQQPSPSLMSSMAMCMSSSVPPNTPSTSMPMANGMNPWNLNLLANYNTNFSFPYLFGGGGFSDGGGFHPQPTSPLYSPSVITPGISGLAMTNNSKSTASELAKRTLVLYRKSSSPHRPSRRNGEDKFFSDWLTKAFNLPTHAIMEIFVDCDPVKSREVSRHRHRHTDSQEQRYWKVCFIVLDHSKTHDNIVSMYEANEDNSAFKQQCFLRKGVDVLLEGRQILKKSSTPLRSSCNSSSDCATAPASFSPPANEDLDDCFTALSNPLSSARASSSRSGSSSATPTPSAFHPFFPSTSGGFLPTVSSTDVQQLLNSYANVDNNNQNSLSSAQYMPTASTANDFDLDSGSSTTAALLNHIQEVTRNNFWDN